MKQLAFEFIAPSSPTLDNFVAGRNEEAVQRLRDIASTHPAERFLYLWGTPASGRTHLLQGALAVLERTESRIAYLATDAQVEMLDPVTVSFVAVDDVDRLGAAAQAALFRLYNEVRERGGGLVASGNAPPVRLSLRPDVVTRLAWGLVYEIRALSDSEKAQAIAKHAQMRGFSMRPELVQHLLTRAPRDMRTLLAFVDALDRYSLESKRPITLTLLRELLVLHKQ